MRRADAGGRHGRAPRAVAAVHACCGSGADRRRRRRPNRDAHALAGDGAGAAEQTPGMLAALHPARHAAWQPAAVGCLRAQRTTLQSRFGGRLPLLRDPRCAQCGAASAAWWRTCSCMARPCAGAGATWCAGLAQRGACGSHRHRCCLDDTGWLCALLRTHCVAPGLRLHADLRWAERCRWACSDWRKCARRTLPTRQPAVGARTREAWAEGARRVDGCLQYFDTNRTGRMRSRRGFVRTVFLQLRERLLCQLREL